MNLLYEMTISYKIPIKCIYGLDRISQATETAEGTVDTM